MASLIESRLNWIGSPTAWQQTLAWHDRQAQARSDFEASSSAASANLFGASTNLTSGLGEITARIASKRLQSQVLAKALNKLA
jgi:hypothetical protein